MNEEWRAISGASMYEVSDLGRVRSLHSGLPLKLSTSYDGYLMIHLRGDDRRKRTLAVHRLVGEAFLGPLPEGLQTRHLDGDPQNAALSNLAYGTPSENALDKQRHGTVRLKTHCPAGHEYNEANTYVWTDISKYGALRRSRSCRVCNTARARARQAAS